MSANLNSLGDGIIVVGLGGFLTSIAYLYSQSVGQSSPSYIVFVVGFFVLSLAFILAGALKIANAFLQHRDEKVSTLKTPLAAFVVGLAVLYYSLFLYRL